MLIWYIYKLQNDYRHNVSHHCHRSHSFHFFSVVRTLRSTLLAHKLHLSSNLSIFYFLKQITVGKWLSMVWNTQTLSRPAKQTLKNQSPHISYLHFVKWQNWVYTLIYPKVYLLSNIKIRGKDECVCVCVCTPCLLMNVFVFCLP